MTTNTNPELVIGGEWELIDKQFAARSIAQFTPTLNTTNCGGAPVSGAVIGHLI